MVGKRKNIPFSPDAVIKIVRPPQPRRETDITARWQRRFPMNTIKIEIGELDPATRTYPVRLWRLPDQGAPPIAQHAIPEDRSLPGQTIAPDEFGSIVLERTGTSPDF